jgi:eukaryotic-like serine/threonine-protein kinase
MNTDRQQLKDLFHAAVELAAKDREAFLNANCATNDDLRSQLSRLLSAHEAAVNFIDSPALIDIGLVSHEQDPDAIHLIGQRIGPYETVRELGRGGMGTVFLAVRADDQYRKQVAIKLVNRGMDTDTILRRFMMERQILANLEHPNIAGLLDGGSTTDGLPYFVMEYVEGQPIDEFCDARTFTTTQRLELFRQVCAALQYAHQNLVIHRDIKPSNILVTAAGVPKLLDFGIAKLLSPGWASDAGDPTASMQVLMTPAYASPEQLRGLSISTASDVYSLGVVLYELLSGHHPYRSASPVPEEMARVILSEEPQKPSVAISDFGFRIAESKAKSALTSKDPQDSKTNPQSAIRNPKSLRGDLDNIVLKALRKEPERRYASVQEFSADIRRHLEGLPVTATPDTLGYRAGKFIQRNKAGVAAAAIVIITLLAGTGITAWQARVARRERDKSEQRFNQVRKLANKVLFDYHDGVEKLPGSTPIREKMVKDALEYLDNLSAENSRDASLQSELASAYFKVGEVQGAPAKNNLGDYAGALKSFKKALAIREGLYARDSRNDKIKLDLTQSYQMVGALSQVTGDLPGALENYRRAFAIFTSLSTETKEAKRDLSTLHTRFASALSASGDRPKAIENYRKAVVILGELLAANPDDKGVQRNLGVANILLGDALGYSLELNDALAAHRSALSLLGPLVTPDNAQSHRDVNIAYERIGNILFKLGNHKEALEIELKSLAIDEAALKADPANANAQRDVHVDYYKIARAQAAIGDIKAALISERKSIALIESEIAANPASSEARADLATAYAGLGEIQEKNGDLQQSLENYKKAVAIKEAAAKADPADAEARGDLSEDYLNLGNVFLKLGDKVSAVDHYHQALSIREELTSANPEDTHGRAELARIYESLGAYSLLLANKSAHADDWEEAKRRYQQSLDIWIDLKSKGKLPADYARKPDEVSEKLAACNAALERLSAKTGSRPVSK